MFALSKRIRGQWRYLTLAGQFSPLAADCWAMDSSTARKVQKRHRDCEIVLILANGSRGSTQGREWWKDSPCLREWSLWPAVWSMP